MAESVTLTRVAKVFPTDRAPLPVLDDIQLHIERGEFVAVLGPSGCGKSTLLRLVAGLERPSAGTVRLGERAVAGIDPRSAVVFQEPRLLPWKTVAANVALGVRHAAARDGRATPEAMLDRVGLTGFERALPHQLSGGMAQRAALARALVGRPGVLLLDEPFASLDALTRLRMQDLLADVCRDLRPTTVMVTHDVDEALLLADRVVVMGPRPATVVATLSVPGGRPRDRGDVALAPLRAEILAHFGLAHTVPAPPTVGEAAAIAISA